MSVQPRLAWRLMVGLTVSIALTVSVSPAFAGPSVEPRLGAAVTQSEGPAPQPRQLTKAAKKEIAVALKIKRKAQRGKVLDYRKARKVTKNKTILRRYILGLTKAGGRVVNLPKAGDVRAELDRLMRAGCRGVNDGKIKPYGYRIRLDNCNASKLEFVALAGAAIVALLVTLAPMPPQAKIVAAVAEFAFIWGAGLTALCNYKSTGIRIYYINVANLVYCRPQ